MNKREDIPDQLSAYLDGELSPDEARRVEQALRKDEGLARELSRLAAVRNLVRRLPRERAGDEFVSRVMARVERANLVAEPLAGREPVVMGWGRHLATASLVLIALSIGAVIAMTVWKTPYIGSPGNPADRWSMTRDNKKDLAARKAGTDRDQGNATETPLPKDSGYGAFASGGVKDADGVRSLGYYIETPDLELAQRSVEGLLEKSTGGRGVGGGFEVRKLDDRDVQYRVRLGAQEAKAFQDGIAQLRGSLKAEKSEAVASLDKGKGYLRGGSEGQGVPAAVAKGPGAVHPMASPPGSAGPLEATRAPVSAPAAPAGPPARSVAPSPVQVAVLPATTAPAEEAKGADIVCELCADDAGKGSPGGYFGKTRGVPTPAAETESLNSVAGKKADEPQPAAELRQDIKEGTALTARGVGRGDKPGLVNASETTRPASRPAAADKRTEELAVAAKLKEARGEHRLGAAEGQVEILITLRRTQAFGQGALDAAASKAAK